MDKVLKITAGEATMLVNVLNDGMPYEQSKRDKLATLCARLESELEWIQA